MLLHSAILFTLAARAVAGASGSSNTSPSSPSTTSSASNSSSSGSSSTGSPSSTDCSTWSKVASDLSSTFQGCGPAARGAIRAPFHDCINNGCDGSLILGSECSRSENAGLPPTCTLLAAKAKQYNVGTADMIQFAAAVAIAVCPLGPRVRALVGRTDSSTPAAEGLVPSTKDPIAQILRQFAAVGMSAADVVALVGSHTVATQSFDDPSQAGKALDSTPSRWDVKFYSETKAGTAPYSFSSDRRMTNDSSTEGSWDRFARSQHAWAVAFTSAWDRFVVVGNDVGKLKDCSSSLPGSSKRRAEGMGSPMGDGAFH
ncbi:class II peroxidase [Karstenula rhodostoma CBS 690.94]|uniref:Peroxidase n=1 Tax=Karstenula rhodostoma CBS 690.94 TaxID=1392251 RepID=A0A9P4PVT3_9PLEO|nr:class II peroxidase [Karstenula rhodostoma CBS 690.94]